MLTALFYGEPERHRQVATKPGFGNAVAAVWRPFVEIFERKGAWLVLLFNLLHKIGDTLANLTFRLLFDDLGFSNDEIAIYDVGIGFWAYLIGIFIGGILYAQMGMKRSVFISLLLMAVSNFSFALLAMSGHSNWGMAGAIGFENIASGIGGVCVVAYFSALCDLRFTAAQYALISAAASIVGRFLTGTTAGALIDSFGYVNFYIMTTFAALPGIVLFWIMMRYGLIDQSIGTAGTAGSGDVRAPHPDEETGRPMPSAGPVAIDAQRARPQIVIGWLLVAVAAVLALWAMLMSTSAGGVHNIGLLADRQDMLVGAGFFAVVGVLLLLLKPGSQSGS
jgi:PAT family beta-lactamase induction signal transducer AmpG